MIDFEFSSFDYEAAVKRGSFNAEEWASYKKLVEHTVIVEVPDDLDPAALLVAGLEAENTKLRAECTRRINENNDKIRSLLAIEYTPTEATA